MKKVLVATLLGSIGLLVVVPAAQAAVVRAEASWNAGTEPLVDIHVSDLEGRVSFIGYNEIPFSIRTDTAGVSSFTDNEAPNTRTLCFWLDNYGDNDVSVDVTLRAPNGTSLGTKTIATEASSGLDFLGSSPAGSLRTLPDRGASGRPGRYGTGVHRPDRVSGLDPARRNGCARGGDQEVQEDRRQGEEEEVHPQGPVQAAELAVRSGH